EAARGVSKTLTLSVEDVCPRCGGTGVERESDSGGYRMGSACPECHGFGRVTRQRQVDVRIPAGVSEGQRIRLAGEGAAGAGGQAEMAQRAATCTPESKSRFQRAFRTRRRSCSASLHESVETGFARTHESKPMNRDPNEPVYMIGVAAQLTGLHPQTVRLYER